MDENVKPRARRSSLRDLIVLSLFGALMVISDQFLNFLPNVHLIALFTIVVSRFYRKKALLSIYVFVLIDGLLEGFFLSTWILYGYIWLILWLWTVLLPKKLPLWAESIAYPLLGALHGILFGILGSPASYFLFVPSASRSFAGYTAYVAAGLPYDVVHMISNFCVCLLALPLVRLMEKMRAKGKL